MNNKLLCPFCDEKLVRHWGMENPVLYCCDNPKCSKGGVGTEQSWQALIDTKKKLDRAIWWLNEIVENHRFTPISTAEKALKELKEHNGTSCKK